MNTISLNSTTRKSYDTKKTRKGLVFIPDISGFTELVRSTDLITGQIITYELLSTIIEYNQLNMQIAEIEGDAVFFYKWEPTPSVDALYDQFECLKIAFDDKIAELQNKYDIHLNLHLKAIAHYGEMAEFTIGGFRKLYGEVVVEAHRLLKNNIPGKSYLLVTDDLMKASEKQIQYDARLAIRSSTLCEIYGGLRSLCFTYILSEKYHLTA